MYYIWDHYDCYAGEHCTFGVVDKNTPPEDIEGNSNSTNEVAYFSNIEQAVNYVKSLYGENFDEAVKNKIFYFDKNLTNEKDLDYLSKELELSKEIINIIQNINNCNFDLDYCKTIENVDVEYNGNSYDIKIDHLSNLNEYYQIAISILNQIKEIEER